jgi:hypothetical protein
MVWNTTEPCVDGEGREGIQVYRYSGDAQATIDSAGVALRATETWYWFHGGDSDLDCKDSFEILGLQELLPAGSLGCETCDEAFSFVRRQRTEGCGYRYAELFGFPAGALQYDPPAFTGHLLFDTHASPSGPAHDDGRMGIVARFDADVRQVLDPDYAIRGMTRRVADDPERRGPPAAYVWVGETCVTGEP